MIQTAEEFVQLRCSDDPEFYNRAAHDSAPECVWREVIDNYQEMRRWVAHNKTVPHSILAILANDPDSVVRGSVARKRKLEPWLFKKLANDSDESVRLHIACNKKTPLDVLELLTNDEWERVAEVAKERVNKSDLAK